MDFTALLKKSLPWIGAAATGNVPALIGMAAKEVGDALGVPVEATPAAIGTAVANATPEQMLALRDREATFKERMQAMGFAHEEELAKIALGETQAYLGDTQDARHAHSNDKRVFWLGIAVLTTFVLDMMATFWMVYGILTGGIAIKDVGLVAAVFGMLGTLNGYVAANAQSVLSYYFGSSRGSTDKTNAMSSAIASMGK